jgi:DNA-binding winged helix-turn-helix (wHTH) protein
MDDEFDGVLRFDCFELNLRCGELRRNGVRVPLQLKPCRLLAYLTLHPGETISREILRQRLWNKDTFVDFEAGLNFCIRQIRKALGENARHPGKLETMNRRGYRFIAPVERIQRVRCDTEVQPGRVNLVFRLSNNLAAGEPEMKRLAQEITQFLVTSYCHLESFLLLASPDEAAGSEPACPGDGPEQELWGDIFQVRIERIHTDGLRLSERRAN